MALELAPIRVNVLRPGIVDTPMLARMAGDRLDEVRASQAKRIPLGRVAQPEDIAGPVLFLVSDLARHVQGEVLNVNGGSVLTG